MITRTGISETGQRIAACILILAALCGTVQAGTDIWSTTGPLTSHPGDKVIHALAVTPDGVIIFCGTGDGRVFSFTRTITPPAAAFSGAPTTGTVPHTVRFNDTSNAADPLMWNWSLGNNFWINTTDIDRRNVSYTYLAAGTYDVSLMVTNASGSDTATMTGYIRVTAPAPPAADFSGTPVSGTTPHTVTFTDNSDAALGTLWNWSFGDGEWTNTTTRSSPAHTYMSAGRYDVSLMVTNASGSDTATMTGYIRVTAPPPPTADFSGTPVSGTAPHTVTFTDRSDAALGTMWNWSFGDGAWTNTTTRSSPAHTYMSAGRYDVSLMVTNASGSDTATKPDLITVTAPPPPTADFSGTPVSGTAPHTVTFTDNSDAALGTMWNWSFGDGAWTNTTTRSSPAHTYMSAGRYDVSLMVTNASGSDTVTKPDLITVTARASGPTADFSGTPVSGTAPHTVTFTDNSDAALGTMWNWSFGDGAWTNTTTRSSPAHTYMSAGRYDVSLTVTNASGSDTATKPDLITVTARASGPTAAFSGTPVSGTAPHTVTFTDHSDAALETLWNWSFGDGEWTNTTTRSSPAHTYMSAGRYDVSLMVTNASGSDTATKPGHITVTVRASRPTAGFSGTPVTGPYPLAVTFTDYSDNLDGTLWSWSFGDTAWTNTTSPSNPVHTYTSTGRYDVSLIVTNATGNNTATKTGYITVTTTTSGSGTGSGGTGDYGDDRTEPQRMEQHVPAQKWSSTTTVNVGGSTQVSRVAVTGTGIDDIIVTATGTSGPGRDSGPAPGIVYQYLEITPARYDSITGAAITFTVPQSWLDGHHLAPQDIVMHHYDGTSWQALPTTVLDENDGLVYFSAACCSFSPFAITAKAGSAPSAENREMRASAQVKTFGELATSLEGASPGPAAPPVTRRPAVMQAPPVQRTTAVPAPVPGPGFPLATIALIGAGCVVLIGSGWYVRRWWIRRQNPALFREYD